MKTWIKLHTKALDSPDIGALSWAHRGIFDALILLAGRLDYRNDDNQETGQLDTLERTAWRIRCNLDEFHEAVSVFAAHGMVTEDAEGLTLTNYWEYQRGVTREQALAMPYKKYLATPHWKRTRQKALEHASAKCEKCGILATDTILHVHHLTYDNLGNEQPEGLMALCQSCHRKEHAGDRNDA